MNSLPRIRSPTVLGMTMCAPGGPNGVLGGPHGAAIRLGMKCLTLQFRLGTLGISRPPTCMVSFPPSRASLHRCQPVDSVPAR